jgi:hypothetical protein
MRRHHKCRLVKLGSYVRPDIYLPKHQQRCVICIKIEQVVGLVRL